MGSISIFKRLLIFLSSAAIAVGAFRCSFLPDAPVEFVQQPVPALTFSMSVSSSGGSVKGTARLAWNYLLYYQDPSTQQLVTFDSIKFMPLVIYETVNQVLTANLLNRGFASGYGDYILGVAQFVIYDDTNHNGAYDPGESIIGDSPDYILVYFQGALTQDLINEFGGLQQGYNLCQSQYKVAGVDKFEVVSSNANIVDVAIAKDPTEVVFPNVR
jgi:hypothetical protein